MQPGRGQIRYRMLVELVFEVGNHRLENFRLRAGHTGGRHHSGAQLVDDAFPGFGIVFGVGGVNAVESQGHRRRETCLLQFFVVTSNTILIQEGAFGGRSLGRRWRQQGLRRISVRAQFGLVWARSVKTSAGANARHVAA